MLKQKLILIGGGGHCKSCIDVIENTEGYAIVGILDAADKIGQSILNYPIIGTDNLIPELAKDSDLAFFITVGQIKNPLIRKAIFQKLLDFQVNIATIVSKSASVSKYARIGKGSIICSGVRINADAIIGNNCIINTAAIIEHDAQIGQHTHISTAAVVNGTCQIGQEVFLGSNSVVANNINIADNIIVGAGSVVYKSLTEAGTYTGNPLSKIR